VVAAHCHGKPGIMAAIKAGVQTIEHGSYLDEEACDAMLAHGTILVPTRSIIEDILTHLSEVPPYAAVKLTALAGAHADAVRMAIARGVRIAMGTDIGLTGMDLPNSWGHNGSELVHMVTLGMTPLQSVAAATAVAPLTLGPQAPRSGQLAAGYDADILTLDADPLTDISVLAQPAHITGVWTRGRQVKGSAA
jgi:imidazolonepropionase-like amidohydrolase